MTDQTYAGGCLCGQVRYLARGEPVNVRICHCGLCRKASGGLFYGRAVFARDALERQGETTAHASSPRLLRHFCPTCGAMVYGEPLDRPAYLSVGLATLDDPDALAPDMHIWVSAKPAWLTLADGLPQHPEGAPW
ncbi:MAG: glutathione-dependent formaldehyde-activating [Phenylobacterium sp.]|jgi:hypothetical protein|nr:glutathione-dependent formaldehyde-activating [Phenylobacterium sp.]